MNRTGIEWTDFSANPLKYQDAEGRTVWGCVHVSEGCRNCYSEALAKRYARGGPFTATTMARLEPFLDGFELRHMVTAKRVAGKDVAGSRCFVGDMTDVFGEWVPDELLDKLFAAFALRPDVTFQVLTKRAERMTGYLSAPGRRSEIAEAASILAFDLATRWRNGTLPQGAQWEDGGAGEVLVGFAWPLPNVWCGTSCEDQRAAYERIPHLLKTPSAVRFLSVEPLLGPVSLRPYIGGSDTAEGDLEPSDAHCVVCGCVWEEDGTVHECPPGFIRPDWVIVGSESGPKARPMNLEWARRVVDDCAAAGVSCFVKQIANDHARKGGNPEHWPAGRWPREFPR